MSYKGEQEYAKTPGKTDIPAFTAYEPCIICGGKGYEVFQFIKRPCWACRGKGKLPMTNADGKWHKRGGVL